MWLLAFGEADRVESTDNAGDHADGSYSRAVGCPRGRNLREGVKATERTSSAEGPPTVRQSAGSCDDVVQSSSHADGTPPTSASRQGANHAAAGCNAGERQHAPT